VGLHVFVFLGSAFFYRSHMSIPVARVVVMDRSFFFATAGQLAGRQGAGHRRYECVFACHDCKSADEEMHRITLLKCIVDALTLLKCIE